MRQQQMPAFEAFNLLGLPHDATLDELNAHFKQRALQCHPDKAKSKGKLAEATTNLKMAQLNNAREVLSLIVSKVPRSAKLEPKRQTAPQPSSEPKPRTVYEYRPWSNTRAAPQPSPPEWPPQDAPRYFRKDEYNFTSTYYAFKRGADHFKTTTSQETKDEDNSRSSTSHSTGKATRGSASSTQSEPDTSPPRSDQSRLLEKLQAMRESLLEAAQHIDNMRRTHLPCHAPESNASSHYQNSAALLARFAEVLTHEINKIQHKIREHDCSDSHNVQYASTVWIDQILLKRQHDLVGWVEEIGNAARTVDAVGPNEHAARNRTVESWQWLRGKRREYEAVLEGWEWEEWVLDVSQEM